MKIFSLKDSDGYNRSDGRQVNILLKEKLGKSYSGITLFLSKGPKGHLSKHYHSQTHEIIIFPTSGSLEINDVMHKFDEWDCVLLEPGDVHGYENESLGHTAHFAIYFSTEQDRTVL